MHDEESELNDSCMILTSNSSSQTDARSTSSLTKRINKNVIRSADSISDSLSSIRGKSQQKATVNSKKANKDLKQLPKLNSKKRKASEDDSAKSDEQVLARTNKKSKITITPNTQFDEAFYLQKYNIKPCQVLVKRHPPS